MFGRFTFTKATLEATKPTVWSWHRLPGISFCYCQGWSFQTKKNNLVGWLNQPIWKICSSNWTYSPIFGVKIKKHMEQPPSQPPSWNVFGALFKVGPSWPSLKLEISLDHPEKPDWVGHFWPPLSSGEVSFIVMVKSLLRLSKKSRCKAPWRFLVLMTRPSQAALQKYDLHILPHLPWPLNPLPPSPRSFPAKGNLFQRKKTPKKLAGGFNPA